MRLTNGSGNGFIELLKLDDEPARQAGVELDVRLVSEQLNARFDRAVHVAGNALDAFVEHLRSFGPDKRAEAVLFGIAPDVFSLCVGPAEPSGNLPVAMRLLHRRAANDESDCQVSMTFEVEAGALPGIANEFAALRS